jgi:hypothetical protein
MGGKAKIPAPPGFWGCPVCEVIKPVADFPIKKQNTLRGFSSVCKACKQVLRVKRREEWGDKPDTNIEARFWPKVDKRGPDECWNWIGAKSNRGYGAIQYQGADQPAHRIAVILAGDEVPRGMVVDHLCKNIACVNPRHLRVCTQKVNSTENSVSPFAKNATRDACKRGHELTTRGGHALIGCVGPNGSPMVARYCLRCWPSMWNNPNRIFVPV